MGFASAWGDIPRNQLLDFLADHPGLDYSITEIAEGATVSRPTVYTSLAELQALGFVRQTRTLGSSRLFTLNTQNSLVISVLTMDLEQARAEAAVEGKARAVARRR